MAQIRYGARGADERRSREHEATSAQIWSEAITALYETDPELIAAILPKPLAPGPEPLVRVTITTVQMPVGPAFGAGWIGVQARHGDVIGEYPVFMPMTTEQSVVGGRETYGEPKKIGDVRATRDGDRVEGSIARMGFTICEVRGRISETREPYEKRKTDFWFKVSPSAERPAELDQDPLLVYGEKTETARVHEGIDGDLILKDSPLDPVADLVVRRVVDLNWTERASTLVGRIIGPVPRADLEPFLHQRYDDLSVLGKKD
jgi:acetoacetate decarboxylase